MYDKGRIYAVTEEDLEARIEKENEILLRSDWEKTHCLQAYETIV